MILDIERIKTLRAKGKKIVVLGLHKNIIQSILDFDFLCENDPSILAVVGNKDGFEKFFFGDKEILVRVVDRFSKIEPREVFAVVNLLSSRRVLKTVKESLDYFPDLEVITIFAEGVPERHALRLGLYAKEEKVVIIGPASIGLLVPASVKLGAVAGVEPMQLERAKVYESGRVAVFSASGGMTNEIINAVVQHGGRISFSFSIGGDRFPVFTPKEAFLSAESDKNTELIIYYGELGGYDEYDLIELKNSGELTKPVIAYIAGTVADMFDESPQFGHAKAKAEFKKESALEKRKALKKAGFIVPDSFSDFISIIKEYVRR